MKTSVATLETVEDVGSVLFAASCRNLFATYYCSYGKEMDVFNKHDERDGFGPGILASRFNTIINDVMERYKDGTIGIVVTDLDETFKEVYLYR